MRLWVIAGAALLVSGCETLDNSGPQFLLGIWGGPHAGADFQGGFADIQFDCASGTIDGPISSHEGPFSVKGTYREGTPGPVKVGQFFRSQEAQYSGELAKGAGDKAPRVLTLNVALEDGTTFGPFTLTEGMPPQVTRCK